MLSRKKKNHQPKRQAKPAPSKLRTAVCSALILMVIGTTIFEFHLYFTELNKPIQVAMDPNLGVRAYAEAFFKDNQAAAMLPIIECESNFIHYEPDGSTLQNRAGSNAIGITQIMSSVHPDPKVLYVYNKRHNTDLTAEDFDIETLQGNLGYALVLYTVRGVHDWECAEKV